MFTASGLLVRFLKVFEKSNYQSVKWVRYMTKSKGTYQIRVSHAEIWRKGQTLIHVRWFSFDVIVVRYYTHSSIFLFRHPGCHFSPLYEYGHVFTIFGRTSSGGGIHWSALEPPASSSVKRPMHVELVVTSKAVFQQSKKTASQESSIQYQQSWRIVPRQIVIPPTNQPHRPRPSHHLPDPPLILPRQPRLCARLDLAHLGHIRRDELVIGGLVDRVHVEDVEWIGAFRAGCGWAEEGRFCAATCFGEEF